MKQSKYFNRVGLVEQKFKKLMKKKLSNKKIKGESSIKKEINKFQKKLIYKKLDKTNTFRKKNNITINNNINNIINNIMINTSDKRAIFKTTNNSQSKLKEELNRPLKNKSDIRMNFLSLKKKKTISRNKANNQNNFTSNNCLNVLSFNNRIWKQTSFIQKRNKKGQRNFQKINNSINNKFNLTTNSKSLFNNSINVSINESSKKYKIIPFNTHNNFDNSLRNKLFGISKNKLIKREMENKIKKVFLGRNLIKKNNNPSLIKLNNRYNTKKTTSKEDSKNKSKNINKFISKNTNKTTIYKKNNSKIDKINKNNQNISKKNFQDNISLNNKKINANYNKINEYMKKKFNNLNINIINKKIFNKYHGKNNYNNYINLNINHNITSNINENKNKIEDIEKNDSKLNKIKEGKIKSNISSLDNTIKFSQSTTKVEDEGELGLDEVKDIIIYYNLNEETQKYYLFMKNDYIDFLQKEKNKYLNFFST